MTPLLRAWWAHRQGLDGSLAGESPSRVLEQSGWARSVGGVGPYLTLFARAHTSRGLADQAVAKLQIHELPSARGCTYVVPRSDFALALRVAEDFGGGEMRTAEKLGVTPKEVDKLCEAVLNALDTGLLGPDDLRAAAGKAARSLGPEGVKRGMSSTLPLALGRLQARGEIRRVPTNGRLDQQRYNYTRWQPSPLARFTLSIEEAYTELARRFFRWIGPATLAEFQWFSGLGVKAAKTAVEPLKLVPFETDSDRLMHADDREALQTLKPPKEPHYVLVSSLDAIHALRRDVKGLLDARDVAREVFNEKAPVAVGGLTDLPSHAILDRGRLIGFWEFDPTAQKIVWATFGRPNKDLEAAVARTESFVAGDLGDARSFSLDSPKSRLPRLEALAQGLS